MTTPRLVFAACLAAWIHTAPAAAQFDPIWQTAAPDYEPPAELTEPLDDPPNLGMRPRVSLELGAGATGIQLKYWRATSDDYDSDEFVPDGGAFPSDFEFINSSFAGTLEAQLPLHRLFSIDARIGLTTWNIERFPGRSLGEQEESGTCWDIGLAATFRMPTSRTMEWRLSSLIGLTVNRWHIDTVEETGTNNGVGYHVGLSFGFQHMFSRHFGWSFETMGLYRAASHDQWVVNTQHPAEFEAVSVTGQLGLVVRL